VETKRAAAATNEKREAFMGRGGWKGVEKGRRKSDASDLTKTSAVPRLRCNQQPFLATTLKNNIL
jgi:hypothetical protein